VRSEFSFELTHRFSEKARRELRERHGDKFVDWPAQGTTEFVQLMCYRDIVRHKGRLLAAGSNQLLAAVDGNTTYFNSNDGLQYIFIEVGTPKQKFLVALDTGSDILWIPCANCTSCDSTQDYLFSPFNTTHVGRYDPSKSSTSKSVGCTADACVSNGFANSCAANEDCPYTIQYESSVTTKGYLVQDLMYLIPQNGGATTTTNIIFGCGLNQSGSGYSFTGDSIPDGLMGLGNLNISVPSTLANANIVQNSFSMCFDNTSDLSGRLVFGDRGSSKVASTNMLTVTNYPTFYWVSISAILVDGQASTSTVFEAIFDSGTTFTYLETNSYNSVVNAADSQMSSYQRVSGSQLLGAEVACWLVSDANQVSAPTIGIQFTGGSIFQNIVGAYEVVYDRLGNAYLCLLIVDGGSSLSIIGHNFMIGKNIAFDRVSRKIKWLDTSCENYETFTTNSTGNSTSPPPPSTVPTSPTPPGTARSGAAISLLQSSGFQILCAFLVVVQLNNVFQRQS